MELREWLQSNKVIIIIRENFDYTDCADACDPDTGEVVGKVYPYGYDKVDCFLDLRVLSNAANRSKLFRAVARKFLVMNTQFNWERRIYYLKEYFRRVSKECGLNITEYDISAALGWATNNMVDDYKELLVRSYFTFRGGLSSDVVMRVVRHYCGWLRMNRSLEVINNTIQMQKEMTVFITKPAVARDSKVIDDRGVSLSTVKNHWSYVKDDVDGYNRSTFGFENYHEISVAETLNKLIDSYNAGNKKKTQLHKDTGVSRSTIDNYWSIITR